MSKLICLDTTIANWVFRDNSAPDGTSPHEISEFIQARKLMKMLSKAGYMIMIPSIVIAEMYCFIDNENRSKMLNKLLSKEGLFIPEFSTSTARHLSRMLYSRYYLEENNYKEFTTRSIMKYDAMILSVALEHGANRIYTKDGDLRKYKNLPLTVCSVFDVPEEILNIGIFEEE